MFKLDRVDSTVLQLHFILCMLMNYYTITFHASFKTIGTHQNNKLYLNTYLTFNVIFI